jgi:H+/Cl- antiporter ClcA
VVAALLWMVGARYQGLGVPVLVESFLGPVPPWDFAVKLMLTVLTVGVGFKGGEVTPLFFVGATLGNVLAGPLGLPFPLLAAVGFVSVFGAAARTPLSSTVMAMELFGAAVGPWAALGCAAARFACGSRGIYKGQRDGTEA